MLEKISALAERMAAKDRSLRIAFNEADTSTAPEPEADRFLKVNGTRLGRDFKLYSFMARLSSEQDVVMNLLEEVVLPLKKTAPAAYTEGLAFMEEQAPVLGAHKNEWVDMIGSFKIKTP